MALLPPLVLVNGAPASGKSVLARQLAGALGLPLVAKDTLKEILLDTVGAPDRERSRHLSVASYELLWTVLGWLLEGGGGAVVDCNCHYGMAEGRLAPLLAQARAAIVHCHATPAESASRYRRRVARAERHPGHFDAAFLDELPAGEDGRYAPLSLPIPTLLVETTDGYVPTYEAILAFVRRTINLPD